MLTTSFSQATTKIRVGRKRRKRSKKNTNWSIGSKRSSRSAAFTFLKDLIAASASIKREYVKGVDLIEAPAVRTRQTGSETRMAEKSQFCSVIGTVGWRAEESGPQHSAEASLMLSKIPTSTVEETLAANKLLQKVGKTHRTDCWYTPKKKHGYWSSSNGWTPLKQTDQTEAAPKYNFSEQRRWKQSSVKKFKHRQSADGPERSKENAEVPQEQRPERQWTLKMVYGAQSFSGLSFWGTKYFGGRQMTWWKDVQQFWQLIRKDFKTSCATKCSRRKAKRSGQMWKPCACRMVFKALVGAWRCSVGELVDKGTWTMTTALVLPIRAKMEIDVRWTNSIGTQEEAAWAEATCWCEYPVVQGSLQRQRWWRWQRVVMSPFVGVRFCFEAGDALATAFSALKRAKNLKKYRMQRSKKNAFNLSFGELSLVSVPNAQRISHEGSSVPFLHHCGSRRGSFLALRLFRTWCDIKCRDFDVTEV